MKKRSILGTGTVKHNALDIVDDKRKVTINCQFFDKDKKQLVADNLNFIMDPEGFERLKQELGVDNLTEKTPLMVEVFRPEGKQLEAWLENVGGPTDDQSTVTAKEDEK